MVRHSLIFIAINDAVTNGDSAVRNSKLNARKMFDNLTEKIKTKK